MKRTILSFTLLFLMSGPAAAQSPELKFVADTLVVQAEGTYEADPDVATLTIDISSQQKELKQAYDGATQSMQHIVDLATRNGLKKEEVSTGVLTVTPFYEGSRKKSARSFLVRGQIVLRVHDFSRIGPILDGSVEDGITDLRSLAYSLADEEAAKQRAVAVAMQRAVGRANAALAQKGQKVGALRYASLDVRQLAGVVELQPEQLATTAQMVEVSAGAVGGGVFNRAKRPPSPLLPPVGAEKITVSATVQCAFQIL